MKTYHVGSKGGSLFIFCGDGEVTAEVVLQPGAHAMSTIVRLAGSRLWDVSGGLWVVPTGNFETVRHDGHFETSANPAFRVSPASRQIREIKRMMGRTEALAKRTAKIQTAMQRAKTPPSVPASDPVIIPTPAADAD